MSRSFKIANFNKGTIVRLVFSRLLVFCLIIVFCSSCVRHKQLVNFRDTKEYIQIPDHKIENQIRIRIQPDDVLLIRVHSHDEERATPYNLMPANTGGGLNPAATALMGYLVDPNGFIDFPILGRLKFAGLTTEEAKQELLSKLEDQLVDPVVNIRFINFRVTVLGEVNSPQSVALFGERVTILDVLGLVGGFTPYSNKVRVLLIRENNGVREFKTINLQSPDVFQSPYFYLQQNDVVYVEPLPSRTTTVRDPISEILPMVSGIISLGALIITLLRI